MRILVGQGSCGIASGAKKTADEFTRKLAEVGACVPVDKTGCIGICYMEPIVDVYDDDGRLTRYAYVQPQDVERIVAQHILGGKPVTDKIIPQEGKDFLSKQTRVVLKNRGVLVPAADYGGRRRGDCDSAHTAAEEDHMDMICYSASFFKMFRYPSAP